MVAFRLPCRRPPAVVLKSENVRDVRLPAGRGPGVGALPGIRPVVGSPQGSGDPADMSGTWRAASSALTSRKDGGMGLAELSSILWRERDMLELLLFKLEEEQLVLAAGRTRWL